MSSQPFYSYAQAAGHSFLEGQSGVSLPETSIIKSQAGARDISNSDDSGLRNPSKSTYSNVVKKDTLSLGMKNQGEVDNVRDFLWMTSRGNVKCGVNTPSPSAMNRACTAHADTVVRSVVVSDFSPERDSWIDESSPIAVTTEGLTLALSRQTVEIPKDLTGLHLASMHLTPRMVSGTENRDFVPIFDIRRHKKFPTQSSSSSEDAMTSLSVLGSLIRPQTDDTFTPSAYATMKSSNMNKSGASSVHITDLPGSSDVFSTDQDNTSGPAAFESNPLRKETGSKHVQSQGRAWFPFATFVAMDPTSIYNDPETNVARPPSEQKRVLARAGQLSHTLAELERIMNGKVPTKLDPMRKYLREFLLKTLNACKSVITLQSVKGDKRRADRPDQIVEKLAVVTFIVIKLASIVTGKVPPEVILMLSSIQTDKSRDDQVLAVQRLNAKDKVNRLLASLCGLFGLKPVELPFMALMARDQERSLIPLGEMLTGYWKYLPMVEPLPDTDYMKVDPSRVCDVFADVADQVIAFFASVTDKSLKSMKVSTFTSLESILARQLADNHLARARAIQAKFDSKCNDQRQEQDLNNHLIKEIERASQLSAENKILIDQLVKSVLTSVSASTDQPRTVSSKSWGDLSEEELVDEDDQLPEFASVSEMISWLLSCTNKHVVPCDNKFVEFLPEIRQICLKIRRI